MKLRKVPVIIAATVAAIGIGGGVAFAAWSASGSGTGNGLAGTASPLTVTVVSLGGSAATFYPGGPAGPVYMNIANPNPYAVTVTHVTWGTPFSASPTTCPSSNISIDANALTGPFAIPVPANGTTVEEIPAVLDLAHSAPDGCQGVSFNVPVTVTGTQQ